MESTNLYSLKQLKSAWLDDQTNTDETYERLDAFLEQPNFYFCRFNMPFYVGNDGTRTYLMFDDGLYTQILKEAELIANKKLPFILPLVNVKVVEMVQFRDRKEYYTVLKRIDRNDKKIRMQSNFEANRASLDKAKNSIQQRRHYFISIDVENYESDHSCILEVGISIYDSIKNMFSDTHLIIKDHFHLKNYKYVPDRKEDFLFGQSIWLKLQNLPILMQSIVNQYSPGILVGHSVQCDVKFMEKIGVKFNSIQQVFDTTILHKIYCNEPSMNIMSLEKALNYFKIPSKYLHNAGNDAHFTLELFLKICSVDDSHFSK